jgi:serine/threonine protein phosphatase PrpC
MHFYYSCYTDVGTRKKVNQDACVVKAFKKQGKTYLLAVICDGVGGLQSGEVASANAVREFSDWFDYEFPLLLEDEEPLDGILFQRWNSLINKINNNLVDFGNRRNERVGTTLSGILFTDSRYYIAHVGDSRIYIMNPGLEQLTEDQTLVAKEVREGRMTEEQAKTDPRKNVILQCVGSMKRVVPDFRKGSFAGNADFLLCTDGFRHKISNEEITSFLRCVPPEEMKNRLCHLTEIVKERGEKDNITSILIRAFSDEDITRESVNVKEGE